MTFQVPSRHVSVYLGGNYASQLLLLLRWVLSYVIGPLYLCWPFLVLMIQDYTEYIVVSNLIFECFYDPLLCKTVQCALRACVLVKSMQMLKIFVYSEFDSIKQKLLTKKCIKMLCKSYAD